MKLPEDLARFARSDSEYAPFGFQWLRGLTLARVGMVAAVCMLLALQRLIPSVLMGNKEWPFLESFAALGADFAEDLLYSFPALILITVVDNLSANARTPMRVISLATAVVAGACIYAGVEFLDCDPEDYVKEGALRQFSADFAMVLSWGGLLTGALIFLTRERNLRTAAQRLSLERIDLDRQMAEARLQMLRAQIEPHFLFNSLATVQGLYRQDAGEGRRLIKDLADYLRGALPDMREPRSTLRRELALSRAYLRVLQVRMGDRLAVEIDVPHQLEPLSVPPMMLATLVENAVKHGVAPVPKGGIVRIRAEQVGERLRVAVSDNGAGFRQTSGAGVGLANMRARLASLFGRDANLHVTANDDAGVTATLDLPLQALQDVRGAA
jgi:two-component sensor histidine kinase